MLDVESFVGALDVHEGDGDAFVVAARTSRVSIAAAAAAASAAFLA